MSCQSQRSLVWNTRSAEEQNPQADVVSVVVVEVFISNVACLTATNLKHFAFSSVGNTFNLMVLWDFCLLTALFCNRIVRALNSEFVMQLAIFESVWALENFPVVQATLFCKGIQISINFLECKPQVVIDVLLKVNLMLGLSGPVLSGNDFWRSCIRSSNRPRYSYWNLLIKGLSETLCMVYKWDVLLIQCMVKFHRCMSTTGIEGLILTLTGSNILELKSRFRWRQSALQFSENVDIRKVSRE